MPRQKQPITTLLFALLWGLSLVALCVSLTVALPAADAQGTVAWSRTVYGTEAWLLAAVALGLGYRQLGKLRRAFASPRFWLLALLVSGVATLGESFAQVGTAALVSSQPVKALLYFAGRVPLYYMGMVLLVAVLEKQEPNFARYSAQTLFPLPAQGVPMTNHSADDRVPPWVAPETMAPGIGTTALGGLAQTSGRYTPVSGAPTAPGEYRRNVTAVAHADAVPRPVAGQGSTSNARAGLPTWGYLVLLLLCWLPYLLAVWPGTVSNDSITQLAEIVGRKPLSNGNPIFQTGLVWLAASVGQGLFHTADAAVALYVCVQAVLMAWLFAYTLRRLTESRVPGWLLWLSTAFFALNPVFPVFAFCMGKDTTFAMAVLWFTLMVWRVTESKWPPFRTVVGLCLSAALVALLRNAGIALVGITLLALLGWAFAHGLRQWRAPLLALVTLIATVATLTLFVLPQLAAEPMPETENWSVPLQQVARVVASDTVTQEERAAIDAVMPIDEIQPAYNGELSDPVKALWRDGVTAEQKAGFWTVWVKLGLKHPATYLSATFHNSYGYLLPGYVSTTKPTFLLGKEGHTSLVDGLFDFTVNPLAEPLKAILRDGFAYAPFRLVTAPGLYGVLALFALAGVMACRKRALAISLLPALITLAGCLLSAVNGYYRYAMPLYFLAPVMLALVTQAARTGLWKDRPRDGQPPVPVRR